MELGVSGAPYRSTLSDLSFVESNHEMSVDIKNSDSDYDMWELKLTSGIQAPVKLAWTEVVHNQDYTALLYRPKNGQIVELEVSDKQFIDLGIINDEKMYICKECKRKWDKDTKYCNTCGDVVMYCKCYEAIEDFLDINGKL